MEHFYLETYDSRDLVAYGLEAGLVLGYLKQKMRERFDRRTLITYAELQEALPFLPEDDAVDALNLLEHKHVIAIEQIIGGGMIATLTVLPE